MRSEGLTSFFPPIRVLLSDRGDASAQYHLGVMYDTGEGVPQDFSEAIKWFRKAADQGNAYAQHNLGVMHDIGRGVPHDDVEAATWYRKAADQGARPRSSNWARWYRQGRGVPQDYVEAHKWFKLAILRFSESDAANRGNAIKNCHLLVAKMTPAQISEAQKLAREWKPKERASSALVRVARFRSQCFRLAPLSRSRTASSSAAFRSIVLRKCRAEHHRGVKSIRVKRSQPTENPGLFGRRESIDIETDTPSLGRALHCAGVSVQAGGNFLKRHAHQHRRCIHAWVVALSTDCHEPK